VLVVRSEEVKKYPNWEGQWRPGSPVLVWDPTKPFGAGQQAPLTPEYQAVFAANRANATAGGHFDMTRTCGPSGMPRVMTLYVAMEIVIRPNTTYLLFESTSPIRRIYTDGRAWPKEFNPQFSGYSIGKWLDTTGEHSTTFDHALVRPWTVSRFYRRGLNPVYEEYPCTEDNQGRRWQRTVSLRQRGLSHADSEESAAARFEILPEIFPDEAVTVCQRQRIDIIFNVHWINHDDATRVDLRMPCFVHPVRC
jgi:hypothetical protein